MKKELILTCLWISCVSQFVIGAEYSITQTWNGTAIDHKPVNITLDRHNETFFKVKVHAPFFNDCRPLGPAGQPFYGLWDYEVAEVFFLNDQNQYVEIELGPHGQHIVLLLNGQRKTVRHSLPIIYNNVEVNGTEWSGEALIPIEYLPPNVTKMNAYAIHGTGDKRTYEALHPVPAGSIGPDFHNLTAFKEFNSSIILATPELTLSPIWNVSVNSRKRILEIAETWAGEELPFNETVKIKLYNKRNISLVVEVRDAPYYSYLTPVDAPVGPPYQNISNHEVLHLFLLGSTGEYFELQLGPRGHHMFRFWDGYKKPVGSTDFWIHTTFSMLTFGQDKDGNYFMRWGLDVEIPFSYLPPNVTKCNAFYAHGPTGSSDRKVSALYPAGPGKPYDFHDSSYFRAIDFDIFYPWTKNETCSTEWRFMFPKCGSRTILTECRADSPDSSDSGTIERPFFLASFLGVVITYILNF